jgi:hypothetical protein
VRSICVAIDVVDSCVEKISPMHAVWLYLRFLSLRRFLFELWPRASHIIPLMVLVAFYHRFRFIQVLLDIVCC